VTHAHDAASGLTDDSEHLGQQIVERLAVTEARSELGGLALELVVAERFDRRLERVDFRDARP
jgi:hypothetical protein